MNPPDETGTNVNKLINQEKEQSDLFFPKHYLLIEVEKLRISIKHFFEEGILSKDDYEYIGITLKMIKRFLTIHLYCPAKPNHKTQQSHEVAKQPSLFDIPRPFPVEVSGLTEGLKALRPKSAETCGPKFPYKISAGTHWNNVIIKFLNDEQVEIWVKRQKYVTDFKEMGMIGKGIIPRPCEQWLFLRVLALCHGEITIKDPEAKDKYKKQKQGLAETLKRYFSIDYDPFYPYQSCVEKVGNSYKIKLLLIPPPNKDLPKQPIDNDNDADTLGIQEFLNETAPQVMDT